MALERPAPAPACVVAVNRWAVAVVVRRAQRWMRQRCRLPLPVAGRRGPCRSAGSARNRERRECAAGAPRRRGFARGVSCANTRPPIAEAAARSLRFSGLCIAHISARAWFSPRVRAHADAVGATRSEGPLRASQARAVTPARLRCAGVRFHPGPPFGPCAGRGTTGLAWKLRGASLRSAPRTPRCGCCAAAPRSSPSVRPTATAYTDRRRVAQMWAMHRFSGGRGDRAAVGGGRSLPGKRPPPSRRTRRARHARGGNVASAPIAHTRRPTDGRLTHNPPAL